jgi:hypothetical protein
MRNQYKHRQLMTRWGLVWNCTDVRRVTHNPHKVTLPS